MLGSIVFWVVATGCLMACRPSVDDRVTHAYALARHPSPRNVNRIETLLQDEDRDLRATSLVIMATLDEARAKRMAGIALRDADGLVRAAAVPIAAVGADAETLRALASLAVDDPVWQVRAHALDALGGSDDPAIHDVFARALSDPVRHVRRAALRAGIDHPGLLPVERLSDLVVSDPDWENRADGARALGASKDPAAHPALVAALADPNEFVRATAARERRGLPVEVIPPPEVAPH